MLNSSGGETEARPDEFPEDDPPDEPPEEAVEPVTVLADMTGVENEFPAEEAPGIKWAAK